MNVSPTMMRASIYARANTSPTILPVFPCGAMGGVVLKELFCVVAMSVAGPGAETHQELKQN